MPAMPYTPTSPSADSDETLLRRVRHHTGTHLGFGIYLLALLAVNAGLAAIVLSHRQFWFVWPLLGWDLGLVAHGLSLTWSQDNGYQRMADQEFVRLHEQAGRR